MAVTQRLEFRQSQSLVMTPQLQQAIKLLQLSNLELADYVDQELERNPLLEKDESGAAGALAEAGDEPSHDRVKDRGAEARADTAEMTRSESLPGEGAEPLDSDYEAGSDDPRSEGWSESGRAFDGTGGGRGFDEEAGGLDQRLSEGVSLRQELLGQLQLDLDDPVERMIGVHLIDLLDEAGYLTSDLETVAELLSCPLAQVEATLAKLQQFDPPGLFARDLRECLALQLIDRNRFDPAMAALLDNLELLARRDLAGLKRACGVDDEDLVEMIAELKALDPKPALAFDNPVVETVVPDVLMRAAPDGGWLLELNSDTLPRVLVNKQYYAKIARGARSKADREYITECLQSANWLVKSLHQRATTILKVASEIVRQQDAFFRKGVRHLRPLTLRDVAEAIEMHESTVSRVTSNKYMATPRGTYELKYFFTSAIAGFAGDTHSAEAVRHRIKGLIESESAESVLSDDGIVELLQRDGIDIARRTVAKYREALRIPSSVERRRQKAMNP